MAAGASSSFALRMGSYSAGTGALMFAPSAAGGAPSGSIASTAFLGSAASASFMKSYSAGAGTLLLAPTAAGGTPTGIASSAIGGGIPLNVLPFFDPYYLPTSVPLGLVLSSSSSGVNGSLSASNSLSLYSYRAASNGMMAYFKTSVSVSVSTSYPQYTSMGLTVAGASLSSYLFGLYTSTDLKSALSTGYDSAYSAKAYVPFRCERSQLIHRLVAGIGHMLGVFVSSDSNLFIRLLQGVTFASSLGSYTASIDEVLKLYPIGY